MLAVGRSRPARADTNAERVPELESLVVFRLRERKAIIGFHERMLAAIRARKPKPAIEALGELIEYSAICTFGYNPREGFQQ
jgi:hypothetical protein